MDHFVRLDCLPGGFEIPADIRLKIGYDSDRRGLVHHGPMSKREFDRLWSLSDCREYRRALEELFRQATWEAESTAAPGRHFRSAVVVAVIATGILAALFVCVVCNR